MKSNAFRAGMGLAAAISIIVWQLAAATVAHAGSGCFDDGRINGNCAAPVAIYCTGGGGFDIFRIDGGKGEFATSVDSESIQEVIAMPQEFWDYGYPWTLGLYFHVSVVATDEGTWSSFTIISASYLPDRQIQVNVQSSEIADGKEYIIRFDECGGNVTYEKFVLPDGQ